MTSGSDAERLRAWRNYRMGTEKKDDEKINKIRTEISSLVDFVEVKVAHLSNLVEEVRLASEGRPSHPSTQLLVGITKLLEEHQSSLSAQLRVTDQLVELLDTILEQQEEG